MLHRERPASLPRPMIEFRQVSKTFMQGRATVTALDRIDLTIAENEMVGIVGESTSASRPCCA